MRCLREKGQCVGRLCRSCGAADLHKVDQDDGVDLSHERDQLGKGTQAPASSCNPATPCATHMPDELKAAYRLKEQVPRATVARFRADLHGITEDRTICDTIQVSQRGAITSAMSLFLWPKL